MPFAFHYKPGQEPPIVLYIAHEDKTREGKWRPAALVGFTPTLRTSGFLTGVGPDEFRSLLLLLSFVTPDGRFVATTLQLAQALHLSRSKTLARFERLTAVRWLGQPIVAATERGNGLDGFSPVPGFIPVVEEPAQGPPTHVLQVVPREVIIEHSRRRYAKTRAEVEREIAEMMDWHKKPKAGFAHSAKPSLSPEALELRAELLDIGFLDEQADDLLRRFHLNRIRRQLAWLPFRMAKNQVGYLIAAIKDDYAAPRSPKALAKGEDDD